MSKEKGKKEDKKKDTKEEKPNKNIPPPVYTSLTESQKEKEDEGLSNLLKELLKNK